LKKIAFITPRDAEYGFSLAGLAQYAVEATDAEDTIRAAMSDPDAGLVIVDERLTRVVAEDRLRELERGWHGVLLVLPSPERLPEAAEDYATRLIRRAIGYHVRLKL
jgi:vacuolar-type H+-ATPase subunit F/Vma7